MFNIECRHFLLCILYIVSCIACSGKKYTANDGESIFSNQNNLIELDIKNPFCFYVLSQEPKHENLIVQIILVETNKDEVILKESTK